MLENKKAASAGGRVNVGNEEYSGSTGNSNNKFAEQCRDLVAEHPDKSFADLCILIEFRLPDASMMEPARRAVLARAIKAHHGKASGLDEPLAAAIDPLPLEHEVDDRDADLASFDELPDEIEDARSLAGEAVERARTANLRAEAGTGGHDHDGGAAVASEPLHVGDASGKSATGSAPFTGSASGTRLHDIDEAARPPGKSASHYRTDQLQSKGDQYEQRAGARRKTTTMSGNAKSAAGGDAPHETTSTMSDATASTASAAQSKPQHSDVPSGNGAGHPSTDARDAPPGQKRPGTDDQGPSPANDAPRIKDFADILTASANGGGGAIQRAFENARAVEVKEPATIYPLPVMVACQLWGEPTRPQQRGDNNYRFGTGDKVKVVDGYDGSWFDFEARKGGNKSDLTQRLETELSTKERLSISAAPFKWIDPAQIPKRLWLYGPHYIRKFLSLVFASGGKGKSSQLIVEALAMVTGKPLLGITPEKHLRVWYGTVKIPEDELQRRFAAAAKHYGLTPEDIGDRLFFNSGRKMPIVIAEEERNGTRIYKPVIEELIAAMRDKQIDVLIIDPFIRCHRVSENDNSAIGRVADTWGYVAEEANCSVMAAHHNRKAGGEGASVDDGRGASALRDAARTARTINTMTPREAENADIDERNRGYYFRADIGKANLTAPAEQADWFRLISVDLENGTDELDVGDSIGVVTAWKYPAKEPVKVTGATIRAVQERVKAGGPWRADPRAKNEAWVGIPVAEALGVDLSRKTNRKAIADTVDKLVTAGFLKRVEGKDSRRHDCIYVEVGEIARVDGLCAG